MNTKYILVAGGAGFIGTNLCERLLNEGHNVFVVDDLSSGTQSNIHHLMNVAKQSDAKFDFYLCDITDIYTIKIAIYGIDIESIYNLACPASPPFYQKKPIHTLLTCFIGTKNLIEIATYHRCPMLLASTSEVYGDPQTTPQSEWYRGNTNCYGERACYDEGKRVAETLMYEANKMVPGKFKIVRIFNTYGPHMRPDDGRFVSNFICQALQGQPLTIYGDGSQTRSICYVDDTVDGLIRMMNSEEAAPINIGNPVEMPVIGWAKIIYNIIWGDGSSFDVDIHPIPSDDPLQRCPDITRAKELLGWEPKVSPKEGLMKTINYFKNIINTEQNA